VRNLVLRLAAAQGQFGDTIHTFGTDEAADKNPAPPGDKAT
jgi:hypothetical protein